MPWLLAFVALLMLAGLTFVWAREFLRLDRELRGWRMRVARLREREADLLQALDEGR